VGKGVIGPDKDARGQVGVVGGFKGVRAMDATLEMICESCDRSPDMPWTLEFVEAETG
jgi:hypothetical protein